MIPKGSDARRLFACGFLTLFLELVLIRYLAGNIWNLGYFTTLILTFMLLSGLHVPAPAWFVLAGVLFLCAAPPGRRAGLLTALALALSAGIAKAADAGLWTPAHAAAPEVHWSPYQKVEYISGNR